MVSSALLTGKSPARRFTCPLYKDPFVWNDFIPKYSVKKVLLNADWTVNDMQYLTGTIALLHQKGIEAIILGPLPVYRSALPRLLAASIQNHDPSYAQRQLLHSTLNVDAEMSRMARDTWHTPYISLIALLCREIQCVEYANPGVPIQFDQAHLTLQGSEFAGKKLHQQYPDIFETNYR